MSDFKNLQAKCQRGAPTLASANDLLAECYGALGKLIAENDRLRSANETWRLSIEAERRVHKITVKSLQNELDGLKGPAFAEKLAALRKDAERYRWLRDAKNDVALMFGGHTWEDMSSEYIDQAIDAVMSMGEQP